MCASCHPGLFSSIFSGLTLSTLCCTLLGSRCGAARRPRPSLLPVDVDPSTVLGGAVPTARAGGTHDRRRLSRRRLLPRKLYARPQRQATGAACHCWVVVRACVRVRACFVKHLCGLTLVFLAGELTLSLSSRLKGVGSDCLDSFHRFSETGGGGECGAGPRWRDPSGGDGAQRSRPANDLVDHPRCGRGGVSCCDDLWCVCVCVCVCVCLSAVSSAGFFILFFLSLSRLCRVLPRGAVHVGGGCLWRCASGGQSGRHRRAGVLAVACHSSVPDVPQEGPCPGTPDRVLPWGQCCAPGAVLHCKLLAVPPPPLPSLPVPRVVPWYHRDPMPSRLPSHPPPPFQVFKRPSRNESLVVKLTTPGPLAGTVAGEGGDPVALVGAMVVANWPFAVDSLVVEVSDGDLSYSADGSRQYVFFFVRRWLVWLDGDGMSVRGPRKGEGGGVCLRRSSRRCADQ